ncbi:MAG TPA: DUF444 family protein [Syntrophorhabdaceae bacterium]|jgi:hypothetical protein
MKTDKKGPPSTALYDSSDLSFFKLSVPSPYSYIHTIGSIEDLIERDVQREKDGFPRKIRLGRLLKPVIGGKEKTVVVPTTVEEKFYHDSRNPDEEQQEGTGGTGDGEEGEVIGEEPFHEKSEGGSGGHGQGEGGDHEIETTLYDLGRILTEKFQLPNLKEKGTKRSMKKFTYDLTDKHRGFGQVLDKKATLRRVLQTNMGLGRISDPTDIDPASLLVSPQDSIYRILSKEQDYEAQALVFFIRDYSGSMSGLPTEVIVTQHVMIYSWLLFQYQGQVETRFILHDTAAREVPDFYTYYSLSIAGGTKMESAYRMVNEIVEKDGLDRDYNIYVFQGTDGDDWDVTGEQTVPELGKMLAYSSRMGITITSPGEGSYSTTTAGRYLGEVAEKRPDKLKIDLIGDNPEESRLIEGIKRLIS